MSAWTARTEVWRPGDTLFDGDRRGEDTIPHDFGARRGFEQLVQVHRGAHAREAQAGLAQPVFHTGIADEAGFGARRRPAGAGELQDQRAWTMQGPRLGRVPDLGFHRFHGACGDLQHGTSCALAGRTQGRGIIEIAFHHLYPRWKGRSAGGIANQGPHGKPLGQGGAQDRAASSFPGEGKGLGLPRPSLPFRRSDSSHRQESA